MAIDTLSSVLSALDSADSIDPYGDIGRPCFHDFAPMGDTLICVSCGTETESPSEWGGPMPDWRDSVRVDDSGRF